MYTPLGLGVPFLPGGCSREFCFPRACRDDEESFIAGQLGLGLLPCSSGFTCCGFFVIGGVEGGWRVVNARAKMATDSDPDDELIIMDNDKSQMTIKKERTTTTT